MSSDFSHAMHVELIRRALWRPGNRAAVMVGAGFSRNADAISSPAPPFPLWLHLTERLRSELYGNPKAEGTPDVLRLAEEYELAAGRTALDDLLLDLIPDAQYQPGPLHDLLLSLPWADIFTTNYDTLLERARTKVHERKYDLVQTPSDIARAERPRIVKLHGSFPSHRPFIFTAEDYRTYPTRFAPYVNMVQQAIMENVFCMIGFSGNDPNFLQWAGWVRDHLGTSAPKIYLCDVLDLTPAKERLYQSLRVIPIDLGPLVPTSRWTTSMRYRKALEWFLLSLQNGRPLDVSKWPTPPKPRASSYWDYSGPPALLEPSAMPRLVPPPTPPPLSHKLTHDDLRQLVESWRSERLAYPGWVVTPESNRQKLYSATDDWLAERHGQQFATTLGPLPLAEQLETLHELLWRVRRALVPLPPWLVTELSRLLERLNPKPELIDLQGVATQPETPQVNGDKLTEIWVESAFALINDAWQDQREEQHTLWLRRLEQVVKLHPVWLARWYYAQCWHHLLRLDEKSVRTVLKRWPENWGLPFWEAKRASVLAELGDAPSALRHAETALERVRQGMSSASANLENRSEESWLIELVDMIHLAKDWLGTKRQEGHQTRSLHPSFSQCDPRDDLRLRERALQRRPVKAKESKTYGFDPGSESTSYHFSIGAGLDEWILVQSLHDGALPLRCGRILPVLKGMAEAVRHLWKSQPQLALALALRSRSLDELKKILRRVDVSTMPPATARSIHEWLARVFLDAMEHHAPASGDEDGIEGLRSQLLEGCPVVLSRLTLHLTQEQLAQAFNIAMKMYQYEPFQRHPSTQDLVDQMFKRVLFAASTDQVYAWLPKLLGLPLTAELFSGKSKSFRWPEPLRYVPWQADWRRPTESEQASWAEPVMRLIRTLQEGLPEHRANASLRLALLSSMGLLASGHGRSFVGALWSQTDDKGLPSHIGFIPSFLVALQNERAPGENRAAVARYLLALEPPIDIQDYFGEFANCTVYPWHSDEGRRARIEWSPSEAETLLRKLFDWWAKKPQNFNRKIIPRLTRHLGVVIIPYLVERAEAHQESIFKIVSDIERLGGSTLLAQPALMILDPSRNEDTARLIQRAIHGAREIDVEHGLLALINWFGLARTRGVHPPPLHLLNEWVEGVVSRRQPGLLDAINLLVRFVQRFSDQLQEHHFQRLHEGLEFLLSETRPTGTGDTDDDLPLIAEERIALREHASHLAAQLATEHQRRGRDIPLVLQEWHKVSSTDPLPEVRQAWATTSEPKLE